MNRAPTSGRSRRAAGRRNGEDSHFFLAPPLSMLGPFAVADDGAALVRCRRATVRRRVARDRRSTVRRHRAIPGRRDEPARSDRRSGGACRRVQRRLGGLPAGPGRPARSVSVQGDGTSGRKRRLPVSQGTGRHRRRQGLPGMPLGDRLSGRSLPPHRLPSGGLRRRQDAGRPARELPDWRGLLRRGLRLPRYGRELPGLRRRLPGRGGALRRGDRLLHLLPGRRGAAGWLHHRHGRSWLQRAVQRQHLLRALGPDLRFGNLPVVDPRTASGEGANRPPPMPTKAAWRVGGGANRSPRFALCPSSTACPGPAASGSRRPRRPRARR
jgi:hypothetical protein